MQGAFEFEAQLLASEVAAWAKSEADKGQIYTRPKVVEFMLTLLGLNTANDFDSVRILEPSCGEGEFVVAIVGRLLNLPRIRPTVKQLTHKLLAIDLVPSSLDIAKKKVAGLLESRGYSEKEVTLLLSHWFQSTDFLLADLAADFTHIVGNPPYVRVESIPKRLLYEYRKRFSTMTDRADLYVPFYEKCLSLLKQGGRLSFICTDRWTKNIYGKSLRGLISDKFSLELFVDLYGIEAFEVEVMTYPAITQIFNGKLDQTVLKHEADFSSAEAYEILSALNGGKTTLQIRKAVVNGEKPWLLGSPDQLALIQKLENEFSLLEDEGCRVFIGAATGANKVYIVSLNSLGTAIEEERLLPVITASELKSGSIAWRGNYIINTYDNDGVIDLEDYPKLSSYLNMHKEALCKRHVAKKDNLRWYKTIDRVYEGRAKSEKLLIPDIGSEPIVLYDKGEYHPNNSIYYICSEEWDLNALRVILLSNITKLFISTYSTKIAKGYLRYQAQHLRKLRLPKWREIDKNLQCALVLAGKENDINSFNNLAGEAYQLNEKEQSILGM